MDLISKFFRFLCFFAILFAFEVPAPINSFSVSSESTTIERQNKTLQNYTYTVRVFHDGNWWIQIYDSDFDHLVYEYLDPIQD